MMKRSVTLLLILMSIVIVEKSAYTDPLGRTEYLADCARCHGVDGKGGVPQMRAVPGYISVDLTRLTESNGGQFPRQEVYDAIDGRKRFPAHFVGDMPTWGLKYQQDNRGPESEEKVKRRISALVDYVESLQPKRTIRGCMGSLILAFWTNRSTSPILFWAMIAVHNQSVGTLTEVASLRQCPYRS